jgi:hypothetical protein
MNIITATTPAASAEYKGMAATLTLTDGTTLAGTFLSVNSKGWNIVVDGVTVSRGFSRVTAVNVDADSVPDMDEDTEADYMADMTDAGEIDFSDDDNAEMNALVAELDGATTAEVADVFGTSAKELRVTLRALGMGVGKGHRYHLTADQIATVRTALEGAPIA